MHALSLRTRWFPLLLAFLPCLSLAGEVRVAVASNFLAPLKALVAAYEQDHPDRIRISAGSTGKLYAQIVNGAPFDLFLAANAREPERLAETGAAVADSRFTYARGQLALWAGGQPLAAAEMPAGICQGDYRRLAIANPKTAPYGAAALQVLDALDCTAAVQAKLIRGENISQAYQFVASGNADYGFVALSQLHGADAGSYWVVPESLHDPIDQQGVLLKAGLNNPAAIDFLDYLRSPAALEIIRGFGYSVGSDGEAGA